MINISFDNPFLLLLLIPMLALVLVPYFIAIHKENKSRAAMVALALHIVIILLTVLAAAGMSNVTVITETELYVVADVSHSMDGKLDLVDEYISKVQDELPRNSEMGVITFGKNYRLHTPLGERITSVRDNNVNGSATDIASALRYADSLFGDSSIKRIVLITDGMSTDKEAGGDLVRIVEDLKANGVYIDVVYVDNNLSEDAKEIQLTSVDFNPSVYRGRETTADLLIESSYEGNVIVNLTKNGESYLSKTVELTPGYNVVNFGLDTAEEGENDYSISFVTPLDTSDCNNTLSFTQRVNGKLNVLLITSLSSDKSVVESLYGDDAVIDTYVKPKDPTPTMSNPNPKPVEFVVPFAVEDLCKYDEIILSNIDVEKITNSDTFIASLDTVVSQFGKSLITVGNNGLQNNESELADKIGNMLPVKFGNSDADPKLYTLVIDSSRSMEFKNADYFVMAKLSAIYLLGLLNENDYFSIVTFSGEVYHLAQPQIASKENVENALKAVSALDVTQGTMIGAALRAAGELMIPMNFSEKQVILVSDGMSFEGGETLSDDPIAETEILRANNITVSALNTGNLDELGIDTMKSIASAGGGTYYFCQRSSDLESLILGEVADEVTDSEITGDIPIIVTKENDSVLNGVNKLANIGGYVYAKVKASAETVLSVPYVKSGGGTLEAPLYAYWSYGNGRVATLTTNLGGDWVEKWSDESGTLFLDNLLSTNTPKTKIDYPYTVGVEYDGKYSNVEIIPAVLNPDATMNVTVVFPDGSEITEKLTFDSYRYFYRFETDSIGKYLIKVSYEWTTKSYTSESVHTISYSPEYDEFVTCSPAPIYAFMRNNGNVFEDGEITLEVDESKIATYVLYFTVPFLAIAAALYIIDTVIRKLKWADVVSLFKRKSKEAKK